MSFKEWVIVFFAVIGISSTLDKTSFWDILKAGNQRVVIWINPEAHCPTPTITKK